MDAFPCRPRRLRTLARRLPTLTVLNLALSSVLPDAPIVLRTLVLATVAVPIVMYGLMPRLHRLRVRLLARQAG